VDDLDEVLVGGERGEHLRPQRLLPDRRDELLDDLVVDVGFQQCEADLVQGALDVPLRDAPVPRSFFSTPWNFSDRFSNTPCGPPIVRNELLNIGDGARARQSAKTKSPRGDPGLFRKSRFRFA